MSKNYIENFDDQNIINNLFNIILKIKILKILKIKLQISSQKPVGDKNTIWRRISPPDLPWSFHVALKQERDESTCFGSTSSRHYTRQSSKFDVH